MIKTKNCAISVGSVTYAIKGRDLLRRHGVKAKIEKSRSAKGCGYAIAVSEDCPKAIALLDDNGIRILDVN